MKLLPRRRPRPPVTSVRADELVPGDRLTPGGELGVGLGGETVTSADPGHEGGDEVVFVATTENPSWVWPLSPATSVSIHDPKEVRN